MKQTSRTLILMLFSIIFYRCSDDPKEIAIKNYVQVVDGVKTDLGMSIKSTEDIGFFTASDSVLILEKQIVEESDKRIKELRQEIDGFISKSQGLVLELSMTNYKPKIDHINGSLKMYDSFIKSYQASLDQYIAGNYNDTDLRNIFKRKEAFKLKPDSILLAKVRCNYTIKNPKLNFAEQEDTRVFYLTPSYNTVVLDEAKK